VWCGGTPTTIEDLLPNWLRLTWKLAPDATFRIGRNFGDRSELVGGSKAKRIKHVSMKVRAVCSRCNSGWMSDLERQSQPILGPLTRGQALTLGPSTQATVSAWAMKTTMMAAFRVAIEAAPEFRSAMVERREPPPGSSVHLAHLDPIALRVRVEPLLYPSDATPSDETRTGFVGYLALDRLGMFVFLNPSTLPAPEIIGGKGRRLHLADPRAPKPGLAAFGESEGRRAG